VVARERKVRVNLASGLDDEDRPVTEREQVTIQYDFDVLIPPERRAMLPLQPPVLIGRPHAPEVDEGPQRGQREAIDVDWVRAYPRREPLPRRQSHDRRSIRGRRRRAEGHP